MPERAALQTRASIWAEVAYLCGWLTHAAGRVRLAEQWNVARDALRSAAHADLTGRDVTALAGDPTFGGDSWRGFVDVDGRWFHVDLDMWQEPSPAHPEGRYLGQEQREDARVVAVRVPATRFAEGVLLTPYGMARMP
jgi:hypothetical protein